MTDLVATRGTGLIEGQEIFDTLLSDTQAALRRGAYEMDIQTPTLAVEVESVYLPLVKLGDTVEVFEDRTGKVTRGVVTSVSHVVSGVVLFTKLSMEVPA